MAELMAPAQATEALSPEERALLERLRGQHLTAVGWIEQRLGIRPTSVEAGRKAPRHP